MNTLLFFGTGFLLSLLLVLLSLKIFPKLGLLDFPQRYGLKRSPRPYPGGLVFCLLSLVMCGIDASFQKLLIPLFCLGLLSFVDDRNPLPASLRLGVHAIIAAGVYFLGIKITFIGDPFHNTNFELASSPVMACLLTVVWLLVIQNALNWFDGIKGLAPGMAGVGFLTLGGLGLVRPELFFDPGQTTLTSMNFFLAGACLGGFYQFWKGKIILGDTGAQVMGFLLAVMAIFSGAKIATTLIVLALPILDAVFVVGRRVWLEKKSPFLGDRYHLHHNLAVLFGEEKTALFLIGISLFLGGIALFFISFQKMVALSVIFVFILTLCGWAYFLRKKKGSSSH